MRDRNCLVFKFRISGELEMKCNRLVRLGGFRWKGDGNKIRIFCTRVELVTRFELLVLLLRLASAFEYVENRWRRRRRRTSSFFAIGPSWFADAARYIKILSELFSVSFSQARSIKRSNNSCCLVHLILNLGPFLFLDFVPFRRDSKRDQEQGY